MFRWCRKKIKKSRYTHSEYIQSLIEKRNKYKLLNDIQTVDRDLIVDDNMVNREVMRKYLERNGIQCDEAVNGLQALELLARRNYNFVYLDVKMPVLDGYQTMEILNEPYQKGYGYKGTVVVVTAFADQGCIDKCKYLGFNSVLPKPYTSGELLEIRKNGPPEP